MRMHNLAVAIALWLVGAAARVDGAGTATTQPTTMPTGRSHVAWPMLPDAEFVDSYNALVHRHAFKVIKGYPEKKRAESLPGGSGDPTYELYVPPDYSPDRMFGVFVWISAGDKGDLPRAEWAKVLDRHHLIWVGVNNVGNKTDTLWRHYMALEAARQAKARFNVDDERVYVGGVSGGGRIASHVGLVNPDTFTGGFYCVGADFWRDVPAEPGRFYKGFWQKQDSRLLRIARKNRFVLVTGEGDFNLANTKSVYGGYVKDAYEHVTLFEVPALGHSVPDAEWFEKAVVFLDSPLATPAKLYEQAQAFEQRKRVGDASLAYAQAAGRGPDQPFADEARRKAAELRKGYDEQVALVRKLIDDRKFDAAGKANAALKTEFGALAERQVQAFVTEMTHRKVPAKPAGPAPK